MARNKPIRKIEFDININGDQRFVDLVTQNPGHLRTLQFLEKGIITSPVKELYIKDQLRGIKHEYPERPFGGPLKVSKNLHVITVIEQKGYSSFIRSPLITVNSLVEGIYRMYKKDLEKAGKITHPYLNFENETFKKLSESERFDFIVCLLFQGAQTAAIEGYLNEKLIELTIPKQVHETNIESKNLSRKINSNKYSSLRELFINDTAFNECFDVLRIVKPPIISIDNRYLGSEQKGGFTAWFVIIQLRQKFKPRVTVPVVSKLLNIEIEGLNLGEDGTTLRRPGTRMYLKYYHYFNRLI